MIYNFADFKIRVDRISNYTRNLCEGYLVDSNEYDMKIEISRDDLEREAATHDYKEHKSYIFSVYMHRLFAEWLPLHDAFVLHSACFDVDGVGVAFAAHSGTGKTTHMLLWKELLGDRMTIVNGDKPIVRFFDEESAKTIEGTRPGVPYAYGTPWNGKEHLGCNMRTPLRHICFIERAAENSCEPMTDRSDAVNRIFNQVYMPKDPMAAAKTIGLIDRLMKSCSLWIIKCNMEPSAAEVAYRTIFEKTPDSHGTMCPPRE